MRGSHKSPTEPHHSVRAPLSPPQWFIEGVGLGPVSDLWCQDPGGCADTIVGRADPRASAVAVSPMWSGLVPFGGNRLLWQLVPSQVTSSDHPGPIRRRKMRNFPAGGKCGMKWFVPPLCTPKGNTRRGWSGHLGSGIPEKPCYKAGTSIMRRGFRPRRRVESQATLWDLCRSSPDPGGNGRTALNSSSHEALPHSLTVWSPDPVRCIR